MGTQTMQRPNSTGRPAPPATSFEAFRQKTQRLQYQMSQQSITNPGDTKIFNTDKIGYIEGIHLDVQATVTSSGAAAGTWDANYFPYNFLKQIVIQQNNGFAFMNVTGFEAFMIEKIYMGTNAYPDVRISPLSGYSGTGGARNAQTSVFNSTDSTVVAAGDALAASKTYKIAIRLFLPLAAHRDLRAGLVMVQNPTAALTLQITTESLTTVANVTAGTLTLTACTITPTAVTYTIPNAADAQPFAPGMGIRNRWISDMQPWTTSGQQDYKVPTGAMIVRLLHNFQNVSSSRLVPAALYATANDPTSQNFNPIQVVYGAVQYPTNYGLNYLLWDVRKAFGSDFPDGVVLLDMGVGDSLDNGINTMNLINTRQLTEFKSSITTAITPAANSQLRSLRQELLLPAS